MTSSMRSPIILPATGPIARRKLSDEVFDRLKAMITSGEVRPGQATPGAAADEAGYSPHVRLAALHIDLVEEPLANGTSIQAIRNALTAGAKAVIDKGRYGAWSASTASATVEG